jgi:hypothetical protein
MKDINLQTQKSWGFYGGNKVDFDSRGFCIKMDYGAEIYLEYNEAQSLTSLLNKIVFKKRKKPE